MSSHESGSLKILSAIALPGMSLKGPDRAGDKKGEPKRSMSGIIDLPFNMVAMKKGVCQTGVQRGETRHDTLAFKFVTSI